MEERLQRLRRLIADRVSAFEQKVPPSDEETALKAVRTVNTAAARLATVPGRTGGNHVSGHRETETILKEVNHVLSVPLSNGKPVGDELSSRERGLLTRGGRRVIRIPAPILSRIAYARVKDRGSLPVVTRWFEGRDAMHRRHPLFPRLLDDGSSLFLDATPLPEETESNGWEQYTLLRRMQDLALEGHYWMEYLGLHPLAAVARTLDAPHTIALIAQWVLLEWCGDWEQQGQARGMFDSPPADHFSTTDRALRLLFENSPFPSFPGEHWRPGDADRTRWVATLAEALGPSMRLLREPMEETGGACDRRLTLHTALAAHGQPEEIPPHIATHFRRLDARLAETHVCMEKTLAESFHAGRSGGSGNAPAGRRPAAIADLLSSNPVRALNAMNLIRTDFWSPTLSTGGLRSLYEDDGDAPPPPLPHPGVLPLGLRLGSAAGATLVNRFLSASSNNVPEGIFEAADLLGGKDQEANKAVHAAVRLNFRRRLAFEGLLQAAGSGPIPGCWLAHVEANHLYGGGCGVDSVTDLVFPAFFFSEFRFARLLRHEQSHFQEAWSAIRNEIAGLVVKFRAGSYLSLRESFRSIFKHIRDLSLHRIERLGPGHSETKPPPWLAPPSSDPFADPGSVFTRENLLVEGAAAPVSFERLAAGNPAALQRQIARLRPHINLLRRIHNRPAVPLPRPQGRQASGFDLDMLHPEALHAGEDENPFLSIDYRPAPRPEIRHMVRILMDFSGSMNAARVGLAKDFALTLSLGLTGFDCLLYLYTTKGSLYQLTEVYDSRRKRVGGTGALATICDQRYSSGIAGNPDAACLLAVDQLMEREPPSAASRRNILIHIGDMEYCTSLKLPECPTATEEVFHACRKITGKGHHLIIGRCGADIDPLVRTSIPHDYLHLPEDGIDPPSVRSLHRLVSGAVSER